MTAALGDLTELALDLRTGWEHWTDPIWGKIEPELWALTHNPWAVLRAASPTRLETLQRDPEFRSRADDLIALIRRAMPFAALPDPLIVARNSATTSRTPPTSPTQGS